MTKKFTIQDLEFNTDSSQITQLILSKIKEKKSLSVIRIGDGEIAVLNGGEKGRKHFYYVHLGRELSPTHMEEINKNIKNAIINCDVLGVPPKHSETSGNPYWKISKSTILNILNESKIVKEKKICSMGIHYELMNPNGIDVILKSVEELYLVTSREVEKQLKQKFPNIKKITTYKIPGEYVYEDNRKYEDFYPTIYKKIESEFLKNNYSGKLLLIGGGFVGKNLSVIFANQGGVSIDLGSVFDNFVGKITRGEGKGPNKYRKPSL